jgi:hypothetical protein
MTRHPKLGAVERRKLAQGNCPDSGGGKKKYTANPKILNNCLSKMGIKTTIDSFTASTPEGYGKASGVDMDVLDL